MERQKTYFNWVEIILLLCVVIIVVLTALPSLIQSRQRANEASTIATLKKYAIAQQVFSNAGYLLIGSSESGDGSHGAYVNDFSKLYYGTTDTGELKIIEKAFADARTFVNGNAYYGYTFEEDGNLTVNDWKNRFALIAAPAAYNITGYGDFWIDEAGVVFRRQFEREEGSKRIDTTSTPLKLETKVFWSEY